jgi:hypothetical protein
LPKGPINIALKIILECCWLPANQMILQIMWFPHLKWCWLPWTLFQVRFWATNFKDIRKPFIFFLFSCLSTNILGQPTAETVGKGLPHHRHDHGDQAWHFTHYLLTSQRKSNIIIIPLLKYLKIVKFTRIKGLNGETGKWALVYSGVNISVN